MCSWIFSIWIIYSTNFFNSLYCLVLPFCFFCNGMVIYLARIVNKCHSDLPPFAAPWGAGWRLLMVSLRIWFNNPCLHRSSYYALAVIELGQEIKAACLRWSRVQRYEPCQPQETASEQMDSSDARGQTKALSCQQGDQAEIANRSDWMGASWIGVFQGNAGHYLAWIAKRYGLAAGVGWMECKIHTLYPVRNQDLALIRLAVKC